MMKFLENFKYYRRELHAHLHEVVYVYLVLAAMTKSEDISTWLVDKWGDMGTSISDFLLGSYFTNLVTTLLVAFIGIVRCYYQILKREVSFVRLSSIFGLFFIVSQSSEQYWIDTIIDGVSYKAIITALLAIAFIVNLSIWLEATPLVCKVKKKGRLADTEEHGLSTISKKTELQKTGREALAEVLLTKLLKTDVGEENYAVGISSGWGTGKTTFLRHIEEIGKDDFEITKFYPWDCGSPEKINQELFSILATKLDKAGGARRKMLAYATMLADIAEVPYREKMKGIIGTLDSQSSLKVQVKKLLKKETKKHLILVDDIDRLDSDELFEVLRIVRVTANFPNIIFIVTYDREHILEMLKAKNINNAELYIKKIFHVELALPEFEPYALPQMLYEEIKKMTSDEEILNKIWNSVFWINPNNEYGITRYIRNFRDVKRFASVFALHISRVAVEGSLIDVSVFDLFWLDVLAYYDNSVYERLRDTPYDIVMTMGKESNYLMLREEYSKDDKESEQKIKLKPYTNIILRTLFRGMANVIGQNNLAVKDNFLTYFSFRVHDNKIGYNDFQQTLLKSQEEDIPAKVKSWCRGDILSKSESLFSHLSISTEASSSDVRIRNNYFAMLMASVPYLGNWPIEELFRRVLHGSAAKMVHDKYLEAITKVVSNTDDYMTWNKILARLCSCETFDSEGIINFENYKSLFTNNELDYLSQLNWMNYVRENGMPRVTDITSHGTMANTFMKEACSVISVNKEDGESYRHSLVVDKLIKDYSHQYSNDFADFIKPFDLDDEAYISGYEDDIAKGIRVEIEELFGETDKYKEFINGTFTASDEDKGIYYERIGI